MTTVLENIVYVLEIAGLVILILIAFVFENLWAGIRFIYRNLLVILIILFILAVPTVLAFMMWVASRSGN
jgi:hypothetical protein